MHVAVVGAHGQIARRLTQLLVARGDTVRGLIRNPDHGTDVRGDGAEAVVCDLEDAGPEELDAALDGVDAVIFAAGAGPGSGPARKETLDRDGAVATVQAAVRLGISRYVMVSAMGTNDPPADDEVFSVYLRAKAAADKAVRSAGLAHTIVRPGGLTDEAGTGLVEVARRVERGEVPRDDVATTLAAILAEPRTAGHTVELVSGPTPVAEAVAAMADTVEPDGPTTS
jgi:uncharacterized protein YbjT (DUF2867 family)